MTEDEITAAAVAAGCACATPWPELAVTRDDGSAEPVLASDAPGPLARLYYACCTRCGVRYPGPFRLPPRSPVIAPTRSCVRGRSAPAWSRHCAGTDRAAAGDTGAAR